MMTDSLTKWIGVIFVILSLILTLYVGSIYVVDMVRDYQSQNENVADLYCYPDHSPSDQIVEYSELSPDKQQKVKKAIEEESAVGLNVSQREYFELETYVRYRNETYLCEVGGS